MPRSAALAARLIMREKPGADSGAPRSERSPPVLVLGSGPSPKTHGRPVSRAASDGPEANKGASQAAGMNAAQGRGRQNGDDVDRFTKDTPTRPMAGVSVD
jgi:hypothetical protein